MRCKNCVKIVGQQHILYCLVKLQVVKVKELDVCGSLVLSNPVKYIHTHNVRKVHKRCAWLQVKSKSYNMYT